MSACTLITTVASLLYTNYKVGTCPTAVFEASLYECFDRCKRDKLCQSYFFKTPEQMCCLYPSRLQIADLQDADGFFYYWLYPNACHPDTSYTLSRQADFCYRIYANSVDWASAQHECEAEGATLVKLNTLKKITTIRDLVTTDSGYQSMRFAIGGVYNAVTSQWEWLDGKEMTTNDWDGSHGYPTTATSNTRVVMEMTVGHKWRNLDPTQTGGYICELPFMSLDPYV